MKSKTDTGKGIHALYSRGVWALGELWVHIKSLGGNVRAQTFKFVLFFVGASAAQKIKDAIRRVQRALKPTRTVHADVERLRSIGENGGFLKLQFGCSTRILKDCINIDIIYATDRKKRPYPYPDKESDRGTFDDLFIIDVTEGPLPLPDNSVEVIFHEDFLEHLNQRDTVLFLAETYRVLKPGGVHRINTPELLSSMSRHSDFKKGSAGVFVYEWDKHVHLNVLTRKYLEELARLVGYRKVIFNGKNESVSPHVPKEFRPCGDRSPAEQIFCDLVK